METIPTKTCNACHQVKSLEEFPTRLMYGRKYPRTKCRPCFNRHSENRPGRHAQRQRTRLRQNLKRSSSRDSNDPKVYSKELIRDMIKSDRKKGRENNLTIDFVVELVSKACHYCGEHDLKRGLDRIDNETGHTVENVVPCCSRCNMTRGNMPYEAWLMIVDGMRKARELNLFGSWIPGNRKRKAA